MNNLSLNIRPHTTQYNKKVYLEKGVTDFEYLIGLKISDIINFDDGSEEKELLGLTILPKGYILFEGNKDGIDQLKPYEFNPYRIVVRSYKGIVMDILSIG